MSCSGNSVFFTRKEFRVLSKDIPVQSKEISQLSSNNYPKQQYVTLVPMLLPEHIQMASAILLDKNTVSLCGTQHITPWHSSHRLAGGISSCSSRLASRTCMCTARAPLYRPVSESAVQSRIPDSMHDRISYMILDIDIIHDIRHDIICKDAFPLIFMPPPNLARHSVWIKPTTNTNLTDQWILTRSVTMLIKALSQTWTRRKTPRLYPYCALPQQSGIVQPRDRSCS
jgi:hypothetical protein